MDAVTVPLSRGYTALVSPEDADWVLRRKWRAKVEPDGRVYATGHLPRSGRRGKDQLLHRAITIALPGEIVDHENGNTLDCRRNNLRKCSNTQNVRNQRKHRDSKSSFKGVTFQGSRGYRAQIMVDRKKINLGNFPSPEIAAKAYDSAARQHFGEFARLNFAEAANA